jgi:tetratricopeptide (TPR) repeat protein
LLLLIISILPVSAFADSPKAASGEASKTVTEAIKYMKRGNIQEAKKYTSVIPSLRSLTAERKIDLFDAFYAGFVIVSDKVDLEGSLLLCAEWTRLYPDEKIASLYYATILAEANKYDAAAMRMELSFKKKEEYKKVNEELLKAFLYNAAGLYHDISDWNKALSYTLKIEKLDPAYPGVGFLQCRLYYNLKRFDEGLKSCEQAFDKNRKFATVVDYLTHAGYYRKKKDYKTSLAIVMKALGAFPTSDGVAATAAADLARNGEYYQALMFVLREDMIVSSMLHNSNNLESLREEIISYIRKGKTAPAKKGAKVLRILNLLNEKKYDAAIKMIDELKENKLVYRGILEIFRAEALEEQEKYREAERVYKTVLAKDPALIMTYCKLFELYYKKMNREEDAMTQLKRARKLKPYHWKVKQINGWLEENKSGSKSTVDRKN